MRCFGWCVWLCGVCVCGAVYCSCGAAEAKTRQDDKTARGGAAKIDSGIVVLRTYVLLLIPSSKGTIFAAGITFCFYKCMSSRV